MSSMNRAERRREERSKEKGQKMSTNEREDDVLSEDGAFGYGYMLAQIREALWMVGRTHKPLATIPIDGEDVAEVEDDVHTQAETDGVKVHIEWASNTDGEASITYPAAQLVVYREDCMLDLYQFLGSQWAVANIPGGVMNTLEGLMYGYRSDAINENEQRTRWMDAERRMDA